MKVRNSNAHSQRPTARTELGQAGGHRPARPPAHLAGTDPPGSHRTSGSTGVTLTASSVQLNSDAARSAGCAQDTVRLQPRRRHAGAEGGAGGPDPPAGGLGHGCLRARSASAAASVRPSWRRRGDAGNSQQNRTAGRGRAGAPSSPHPDGSPTEATHSPRPRGRQGRPGHSPAPRENPRGVSGEGSQQ